MSSSDRQIPRRLALAAALGLTALWSSGCGFQLRTLPALPFRSAALTGFAPRSPLAQALADALRERVALTPDPARAEVVLQALAEARERSVVAQTAAGQVREVQLRLRFRFRAHAPGGRELVPDSTLVLARDMSYHETAALAKEHEEEDLYRGMQADVVMQVMRRLALVRP